MTSLELKELVKSHFSLVEADATEEIVNEEITETFSEESTEEVAEVFGEIADENSAFILKFPGDELEVGDKVIVVTTDGQEMDAPDGEHKLAGGIMIVTKDSIVESISKVEAGEKEEDVDSEMSAEGFDARTDAEEEGYKDGMKDAVEDIKEAIAEVVAEDMAEEEEIKEEEMMDAEAVVKEIVEAISEEMGKMKEKMAYLEDKVKKFEEMPAADPVKVMPEASVKPGTKFSQFNVESAANADRIKLAIQQFKTLKK